MKEPFIGKIIVFAIALMGATALYHWFTAPIPLVLEERVPGTDGDIHSSDSERKELIGELIVTSPPHQYPYKLDDSWPCFRGSDFNSISREAITPVAKDSGFKECWTLDVGEGHAGAAILESRVYLLDYDREKEADALRCLSLVEGDEYWRFTYPVRVKRNHGMSRTVPYVTSKYVVSLGPKCHVVCLDSDSGEKKWALDLVRDFGATVPPWYAGQCPLIDKNRVILAPGGSALMIAVDCETGQIVWQTPNPLGWTMTHSSITPMEFNGKRMYVYCASGGVAGVSAEDGRLLWETDAWKIRIANVPSPAIVDDSRLFLSGGYQAGSMMLKLIERDGKIIPTTLFKLPPERFGSAQHTPIVYQGHVYGVRPDGQLVCLDLDGNEKWTSTGAYKFGIGPYAIVGSLIYVMDDEGLLSRVEATPEAFRMIDQTQVLHGHDSWGPIAFASGRMILRDLTKMVCLDITSQDAG